MSELVGNPEDRFSHVTAQIINSATLLMSYITRYHLIIEPAHEKTNNLGFRSVLTPTGLCNHRSRLEACNFGFKKKMDYTICVAKTKTLISCAVSAQLICVFVCLFSHMQIVGFLMQGLNCAFNQVAFKCGD